MMTLDEAIKHCYEEASKIPLCDCSKEHIQLAQWLEELKTYRKFILYINKYPEKFINNPNKFLQLLKLESE